MGRPPLGLWSPKPPAPPRSRQFISSPGLERERPLGKVNLEVHWMASPARGEADRVLVAAEPRAPGWLLEKSERD